jgi:broad specificity phosphatase PhoE
VVVTHGDVIREAIGLWARDVHDDQVPENGCVLRVSVPSQEQVDARVGGQAHHDAQGQVLPPPRNH